jgi:hypothetical protein
VERPAVFRRVAAVAVTAAVLVFSPGIAQAVFTASVTGQVSASTFSMAAPVGAAVTASCPSGRKLNITVTSYGTVPRATSYEFTVSDPDGTPVPTTGGTYADHPAAKGTWTYRIRGLYTVTATNVWKGQPFEGTIDC